MVERKDFVRGGMRLSCATAIGLALLAAGPAWAQSQPTGASTTQAPTLQIQDWVTTPKKPVQTAQTTPQSQQPGYNVEPNFPSPGTPKNEPPRATPGYLFNWRNAGHDLGETLADKGIYLRATLFQAEEYTAGGGARRGSNYLGLTFFGADIDAEKMFGWKGAYFTFTGNYQFGQTSSTANFASGSPIATPFGFGDEIRLLSLAYNQSFDDHKYQFQIGRTSPGFSSSPYLSPPFDQAAWHCSFFDYSCGIQAGEALDPSKPTYLEAGYAGTFTYHPDLPYTYIKGGVFESVSKEATIRSNTGWPGRDWGMDKSSGGFFPLQIGKQTDFTNADFPETYNFGAYFDSSKYPDKLLLANGRPLSLTNRGAPKFDNTDEGIWLNVQKVVWRPEISKRGQRGLTLFGSVNWDGSHKTEVEQQYIAGFIETGLSPSRAEDTINFDVSYIEFNAAEVQGRDATAINAGSKFRMARAETTFELNYGFAIAPGLTLHPFVQYIIHPDNTAVAIPQPIARSATEIGAFLTTSFGAMFGLPTLGSPSTH
jgi:porin